MVCHAGDDESLELLARLRRDLPSKLSISVVCAADIEDADVARETMFFALCERADLCIPLLSAPFGRSAMCERQLTYSKDCKMWIIPLIACVDWCDLRTNDVKR